MSRHSYKGFEYTVDHNKHKMGSFTYQSFEAMKQDIDEHFEKIVQRLLKRRADAFLNRRIIEMEALDKLIAEWRGKNND